MKIFDCFEQLFKPAMARIFENERWFACSRSVPLTSELREFFVLIGMHTIFDLVDHILTLHPISQETIG